jgi:molybdopterin converting factor small subunit
MALITVKFNGIWKLYAGTDRAVIEVDDIDTALSQIEKKFAVKFEEKLKERGVKLQGGILNYSYIVLNGKNAKTLKERSVQDGDILDLFVAIPGG